MEGYVPSPARPVYRDAAPLYLVLGQEKVPALPETAVGENGRVLEENKRARGAAPPYGFGPFVLAFLLKGW